MKITPVADRVVLKTIKVEDKTKSGIIIAGKAEERPMQAEIIAVGPGGMIMGNEIKMYVKPGQKVIFNKYVGTEVKIDDEDYVIVKQDDIYAILED